MKFWMKYWPKTKKQKVLVTVLITLLIISATLLVFFPHRKPVNVFTIRCNREERDEDVGEINDRQPDARSPRPDPKRVGSVAGALYVDPPAARFEHPARQRRHVVPDGRDGTQVPAQLGARLPDRHQLDRHCHFRFVHHPRRGRRAQVPRFVAATSRLSSSDEHDEARRHQPVVHTGR